MVRHESHLIADAGRPVGPLQGDDAEAQTKRFLSDATKAGLSGLKGHRSVGGCRASIYNAFPEEGVKVLCEFMREFERKG